MGLIRLDKFLADNSVGTRTEVKKYIKNGRITIDGVVVKDPALKIDTDNSAKTDLVSFYIEKI